MFQHFSEFRNNKRRKNEEMRVIEYASGSWRWLEPDSRSPFINFKRLLFFYFVSLSLAFSDPFGCDRAHEDKFLNPWDHESNGQAKYLTFRRIFLLSPKHKFPLKHTTLRYLSLQARNILLTFPRNTLDIHKSIEI